jgi:hypothetical protein
MIKTLSESILSRYSLYSCVLKHYLIMSFRVAKGSIVTGSAGGEVKRCEERVLTPTAGCSVGWMVPHQRSAARQLLTGTGQINVSANRSHNWDITGSLISSLSLHFVLLLWIQSCCNNFGDFCPPFIVPISCTKGIFIEYESSNDSAACM